MADYVEWKRLESADGLAAVTIEESDSGLCNFTVWKFYDPAPEIPEVGGPVWVISRESGLYATPADAEAAARAEITWLKG